MPITSIVSQPVSGALTAAYRPVIVRVQATATGGDVRPPFVACDIYVAEKYYKTMIRTAPDFINPTNSDYVFDIADALQEYLQPDIAEVDNQLLLQAPHMSAKVFCRFRSSGINDEGFTVEEGTKPVQGTKFTEPVAGDGFQTNTFFVINASLQHEDNQDLAEHLTRYKQGTWATDAFPLTHRTKYFFCDNSSDHFPLIYSGECLQTDLLLNYRLKGESGFTTIAASDNSTCEPVDYEVTVNGNRVDIDLAEAIPSGQKVFVQIKLQTDSVWTDKGFFTTQSFFFNVPAAGEYDIRIVLFCSDCLNSNPASDEFTIAEDSAFGWRGIHGFCVREELPDIIYIALEIRDITTEETWYPDNVAPEEHSVRTFGKLYAKFFSDYAMLTPLSVVQNGLKIHVKSLSGNTVVTGPNTYYNEIEEVNVFTVDVNGDEVLLSEEVDTSNVNTSYAGDPGAPTGDSSNSTIAYDAFPGIQLIGGNTGERGYADLEEYNITTGAPTGVTKANDIGDPDYIAPSAMDDLCTVGPPHLVVYYGGELEIAKLEIRYHPDPPHPSVYYYYPTVGNTGAGGYIYKRYILKEKAKAITLKVRSLASGVNNNGFITVLVTLDSNAQQSFEIPDNIETTLPVTYYAVKHINISNN